MKIKYFIALGIFVSAFTLAHAQILPLDPEVRTGKLSNGFTYYIRHNQEPKNRAVFFLVNKVGSIQEEDDQRGLAHFIEHMNFNGTKHFPKNELLNYLQKTGVRFGADINAYTSYDETVYQLPLPSDDPKIIRTGLEIMHDWANGVILDETEINKERGVILEEKRLRKGAQERMQNKYFPLITNNSRYSARLPIGTDDVLNNFKPETIRRFYRDWYRPNLQALIVVGDINVEQMEEMIRIKFVDLKNPVNQKPRIKYAIPLTGKNQFIAVTDPELTATSAQVMFKQPALQLNTVEDYRLNIVRALYNDMLGGRYAELKRQADPPFLGASASVAGFMGGLDSYSISVTAKPGELKKGFKAAWSEHERVRRFGFTINELTRAKTRYQNQFDALLKEKGKNRSESYMQEYVQLFLNNVASPGVDYEYQLVKDKIEAITLAELNAMAKNAIHTKDRDILIMAPEKDKEILPTETAFNQWIEEVEIQNMSPFSDETGKGKLLNKEPIAGSIVRETKDEDLDITTLVMSNGIKVLLKPTNFKNNEVSFTAFSPGGHSLYNDAEYESAIAANVIPSLGAGNFNPTEIGRYYSGKQFNIRPSIGERGQNINGTAVIGDLEAALELMYAYLTEPRKDSILFQGMISQSKGALINRINDPNSVFQDTISAVLGNYNIRRTGPKLEKLNQVNLNKAYAIYKERFANKSGFTFVFVGNIDVEAIKPMLVKYIASLPTTSELKQAKNLDIHIPEGIIEKTIYKGIEQKATVNLIFSGTFDYSFADNLKLDALKETLKIRLLERLREDESGVYSPEVQTSTVKLPQGRFSLVIKFGCAPQNVDKLIGSSLNEVEKIKIAGPLQINLDKFKAESLRTWETTLTSNSFWLGYLSNQLMNKDNLAQFHNYNKELNAITRKDVEAVAAKYLTGKNYIKLVLMPEKSK